MGVADDAELAFKSVQALPKLTEGRGALLIAVSSFSEHQGFPGIARAAVGEAHFAARHVEKGGQLGQLGRHLGGQLREQPAAHLVFALPLARDSLVGIAAHAGRRVLGLQGPGAGRVRRAPNGVAEVVEGVGCSGADVGQYCLQRKGVAVNVGEDRQAHYWGRRRKDITTPNSKQVTSSEMRLTPMLNTGESRSWLSL